MEINLGPPAMAGQVNSRAKDKPRQEQKLLEVCQEFEAVLWQQILRQARQSPLKTDLLGGGAGEDIFQDLLDGEYAKSLSQLGPGSLAKLLYDQLADGLG